MVTIEQKLEMFSKLLHRSMSDKFSDEMDKIRKSYEARLQSNRIEVDREAEELLNKSQKKAVAERAEMISKIRISIKKDYMAAKEKFFDVMMEQLVSKISIFTQSSDYGEYLISLAKKLYAEDPSPEALTIYMTDRDREKYAERIKEEFVSSHQKELSVKVADDSIIGGFIAENPNRNIRINFSIKALLEDNRSYMMQTLFKALEAGETGDANGTV